MADNKSAGNAKVAGVEMFGVCAGNDDAARRYISVVMEGLGTSYVDYLGAAGDDRIGAKDGLGSDVCAFDDDAAGSDEAVVFDNHRCCLDGFEDAAYAYAAAEMYVFAYLGAAAYGGPSVDHCAAVDVGSDVNIAGHHHDTLSDKGAIASCGGRDDPYALRGIVVFKLDFVVVFERTCLDGGHTTKWEIE